MYYVVGSGPAGVACATALVRRGEDVTMLDVGFELEPERQAQVEQLHDAGHTWREDEQARAIIRGMKADMVSTMVGDGMPKKLRYGSDYPYRGADDELRIERDGVDGSTSFAKGGFSTVWGAQSLPFRDADIREWPLDAEALSPYYRSVFSMMDIAAEADDLERLYPLYTDEHGSLTRSAQAGVLMDRYRRKRATLNDRGIYLGASRIAMDADPETGCPHCGLKIFGCCPRGSVYDATKTLDDLRSEANFSYEPGVIIERVEETDDVVLTGRSVDDGHERRFVGEKAFLACGTIATTKILLNSLDLVDTPVSLKESPYFILPMLNLRGAGDVTSERLNTLAQLYLEILDSSLSEYTIHFELFTYNELYERILENKLGPLRPLAIPFMKPFLSRFLVGMGYLHSAHNDDIRVRLTPEGDLELSGTVSMRTRATVWRVALKLLKNSSTLNVIPIVPSLVMKAPGESFHLGGSFPMSKHPTKTETDMLGRPQGFERVHAVDSTIFPTVPASTITPTIMAMAYRIGDRHDEG